MKTALLIIDMQNGFCLPEGKLPSLGFGLPNMDKVIEENACLLEAARNAGLPVIFTRHVFRPGLVDAPARIHQLIPEGVEPLIRGSWDADIIDELAPVYGERIIDKNRYDAFLYTDLELQLRSMGVTGLIVSGVVTSVCLESTVRSAEQRDFTVAVAADCTSAAEGAHEAALSAMAAIFATVLPWRDAIASVNEPTLV